VRRNHDVNWNTIRQSCLKVLRLFSRNGDAKLSEELLGTYGNGTPSRNNLSMALFIYLSVYFHVAHTYLLLVSNSIADTVAKEAVISK